MNFEPCTGNCTEDGTHCEGCGRSHEEIAETRALVDQLARFVVDKGYDNPEAFVQFVAIKAVGKARAMQMLG